MFQTFRHRLLFWFLVFIGSNLIIIGLARQYLISREEISQDARQVERVYTLLLKVVNTQQDFFNYDSRNEVFFRTQTSTHLKEYDSLHAQLATLLKATGRFSNPKNPVAIKSGLWAVDSLFKTEVQLMLRRGYKDYSAEGAMRIHAHWLERHASQYNEKILTLRRFEKDYIIRNESVYVDGLNALGQELAGVIARSKAPEKDSIIDHLAAYQAKFNEIVELDRQSGLKDNSGLKLHLQTKTRELENQFEQWVDDTQVQQQALFRRLTISYGLLAIVLLGLSFVVSLLIAQRITRPLTDLTEYITRFVDSNFTFEEKTPPVRTRDEIGKLTENFAMLKNEVISRLQFFKQKVDERTAELADANARLVRLNKANSRFVPNEFLHYLNKPSIEDIKIGDYAACEMTIMFTDIRSFTQISEKLTPQENFDFLNSYLREIVPVIRSHHGFIDKFIGDSIMALFPKDPQHALQAALEINATVAKLNQNRSEPLLIGTGIHTGRMILGTIGHEDRLETTVISDAVNIAARVESLTRHYDCTTLVTKDCLDRISDLSVFSVRLLDVARVKGKTNNIELFELLDKTDRLKITHRQQFESAVQILRSGKPGMALPIFQELAILDPDDGVVSKFIHRCEKYLKHGLPENWDGVEAMTVK